MELTREQRSELGRRRVQKRWSKSTPEQRTAEAYRLLAARDAKFGEGKIAYFPRPKLRKENRVANGAAA